MNFNWHYIKNNDYPKDNYEKLLIVEDSSSDLPPLIGFSYVIGFWREDAKAWDNFDVGWIQNKVVAWCDLPTNKDLKL